MTIINVSLNGAPAHVEVAGSGSPPLLLIGGAVPPGWADGLIAELDPTRQTIYFDYRCPPGWMERPDPRTQVALGSDAIAVLDHLGVESAHVLGYSRGAVAAYSAALEAPDRIRTVVLLAPVAPFRDMLDEPSPPLPADLDQMMDLMTRAAFSDAFIDEHPVESRAMTQAVIDNEATVVRVSREEEQALPDDRPVVQPTLIITAGADRLVDRAHSDRLLHAVPGARHTIIEGGSHLVAFERPAEVARTIESFLAEPGA